MAAVAEMGEVDEMHSKEEVAAVNGDINNDVDMEEKEEETVKKSAVAKSVEEVMDVDEEGNDSETGDKNNECEKEAVNSSDEQQNGKDDDEEDDKEEPEEMEVRDEDEKEESSQDGSTVEKEDNKEEDSSKDDVETVSNSEDNKSVEEEDEEEEAEKETEKDKGSADSEKDEDKDDKKEVDDEVHEIDDDDDDDDVVEKPHQNHETIELNDSGGEDDGDCIVVESSEPTENGTSSKKKDNVINLTTPDKKNKNESKAEAITPRRSSRNLNKTQTYIDSEKEELSPSEESDIEEVLPQDPLAVSDAVTLEKIEKPKKDKPSTIVVKDTKRLVEIASKTNNSASSKKEPTLVIIDTNSILSGRGPVPISKPAISTSSYPSVLPVAVPAQGMYPPNMRATITPIPVSNSSKNQSNNNAANNATPPPLLPTLTDDMFVVEAPSFIVPYVYEKPPKKELKEFVKDMKEQLIKERKEKEKKEKEKSKEKKESEDKKDSAEKKDGAEKKDSENKKDSEENNDEDDDESYKDLDESSSSDDVEEVKKEDEDKPYSYFQSPLGKFFIDIGVNLVQEFVQNDLLKQQKRKRDREGGSNPETNKAIHSILKNLEFSKENNEPFKMTVKKCEFCNFKSESALAMAYHLETPHMKNFVYRCNFCTYEVRSPHDILFHMEAEHAVRAHLERAPAFHQCPNCPFEDNQKGKVSRHLVACMRKFKPERNLDPPVDWEPPAKIPRVPKMRQQGLNATATAYQAMAKSQQYQLVQKMQMQNAQQTLQRGRGRPTLGPQIKTPPILRPSGLMYKQQTMSGGSVLVPTNYQLSGNQVFQVVGGQDLSGRLGNTAQMSFVPNIPSASNFNIQNQNQTKKPVHQPSISITPLPRGSSTTTSPAASAKPGDSNSKNSFVICEICDGYIKDLEQLRNHMQWIHKIKIHPKMIYNRPPLNCQKCQFRFFTDQGLERHLLGSHGLVTSSMQDAANKSKDSGRCPVCGRVYQWKLLNHVARDHNMTLKPAHLSYKCTVCTATFGMYKQFENHVYSAHSVVAKRVMDKKNSKGGSNSSGSSNVDIKPLKINDEITIIPQPPRSSTTNGAAKEGSPSSSTGSNHSRTSTPGTSKNADSATTTPSTSRAERLARRNASGGDK